MLQGSECLLVLLIDMQQQLGLGCRQPLTVSPRCCGAAGAAIARVDPFPSPVIPPTGLPIPSILRGGAVLQDAVPARCAWESCPFNRRSSAAAAAVDQPAMCSASSPPCLALPSCLGQTRLGRTSCRFCTTFLTSSRRRGRAAACWCTARRCGLGAAAEGGREALAAWLRWFKEQKAGEAACWCTNHSCKLVHGCCSADRTAPLYLGYAAAAVVLQFASWTVLLRLQS